jgi:hypothetical protein
VREIRTPRSVGTGGGRPPPVTRWGALTANGTFYNTAGVAINTVFKFAGEATEACLVPHFTVLSTPTSVQDNPPQSPTSDTSIQKVISLAGYRHILRRVSSQADTFDENIPGLLNDDPESRFETKQLILEFLNDLQTEDSMENYELAISDIIDRHGKTGIAALEAQLFRPAVEPLSWKFLGALGVRRGVRLDVVAKRILLGHLNSTSAGRRSASVSALGAFPDAVVLRALERRAAIETTRIVLATLKAHISVLRRDGLPTAKIA